MQTNGVPTGKRRDKAMSSKKGLKKFKVTVEKEMYASGVVIVEAEDPTEAVVKVKRMIGSGKLQTTDVDWGETQYEDCSFDTTGDVDDV